MGKPKYSAYKPINATNDIQEFIVHRFDNTKEWTARDIEMFKACMLGLTPSARIARMQANLDGLKNITPKIKMHADAIRAIYEGLGNRSSVNRDGIEELREADVLWERIMVLRDIVPKAIMGSKNSKVQSDRAKLNCKLTEDEEKRIAAICEQNRKEGSIYGTHKELAGKYKVTPKTIANIEKKYSISN